MILHPSTPLQDLTFFRATVRHQVHETSLEIMQPSVRQLDIANLSGGSRPHDAIHPMGGARHSYIVRNPARWQVVQPALPVLTGEALGGTRLHYNRLTDLREKPYIDLIPYPVRDLLMLMRFRLSAPDSAGFTIRYRVGLAHLQVTVAEPRLDRRLVFAVLTALNAVNMWSPHAELAGMLAPFRRKSRDRMPPHIGDEAQ